MSSFLKTVIEVDSRMVRGRLFQIAGPAAVKDLSPIIFLPMRTVSRVLSDADLVIRTMRR